MDDPRPKARPYSVAQSAPHRTLVDLVAFARSHAALDEGWMSGREIPQRLCDTALTRQGAPQ